MLKLTADKHEASRGLSATAELLVMSSRQWKQQKANKKEAQLSQRLHDDRVCQYGLYSANT